MNPLHFIAIRWTLYVLEILFACGPFFGRQKRRRWFYVSLAAFLASLALTVAGFSFLQVALFEQLNFSDGAKFGLSIAGYLLFPSLIFLTQFALFQLKVGATLSRLVQSMAVRSLAFAVYILFVELFGQEHNFLSIYGIQSWLNGAFYLGVYAAVYVAFFLISWRFIREGKSELKQPLLWVYLGVLVLLLAIHAAGEVLSEDRHPIYPLLLGSEIITYIVLFVSDYLIRRNEALANENQIVTQLMQEQARQFKFSKANAEDLRRKAHDLKHQVHILRQGGEEAKALLDSLEGDIDDFESTIYLDNDVLNIVLREKWAYCKKHRIRLSYSGDPSAFSSLSPVDLFTLLGNILDNAIEATMKLQDKSRRVISATIHHRNGMSTLRCDNFYDGELLIEAGRIHTSKRDEENHGFGLASIARIIKHYGGVMDVKADQGIFVIKASIPDEE